MPTTPNTILRLAGMLIFVGCFAAAAWGCSEGSDPPADAGFDSGPEDSGTEDGSGDPLADAGDPGADDHPGDPGQDAGSDPDAGDPGPVRLPSYSQFELQARANLIGNPSGAFNLEPGYMFSSEDAAINDQGQVSFRLTVTPDDTKAVWFGGAGQGTLVYSSPAGAFMSAVSVNNSGLILFELSFVTTAGLYYYDGLNTDSGLWSTEPLGAQGRAGAKIGNNQGMAGFRADFGNGHAHMLTDGQTSTFVAKEVALDGTSPYAFLFTPDFNDHNQLASKVRLGPGDSDDRPDEIRRFEADGTSILIASDRDGDPGSPYLAFDSTRPALNDNGLVAFIATLDNDIRGVFLSDGDSTVTIASSEARDIAEIEPFSPDVNNRGLVIFRAKTGMGERAIFIGNGLDLKQIIKEHDEVDTDVGPGRIDQHDPSYPAFGGTPSINNQGDVVFTAGLTPEDDNQVEWGTGVFRAVAD